VLSRDDIRPSPVADVSSDGAGVPSLVLEDDG